MVEWSEADGQDGTSPGGSCGGRRRAMYQHEPRDRLTSYFVHRREERASWSSEREKEGPLFAFKTGFETKCRTMSYQPYMNMGEYRACPRNSLFFRDHCYCALSRRNLAANNESEGRMAAVGNMAAGVCVGFIARILD